MFGAQEADLAFFAVFPYAIYWCVVFWRCDIRLSNALTNDICPTQSNLGDTNERAVASVSPLLVSTASSTVYASSRPVDDENTQYLTTNERNCRHEYPEIQETYLCSHIYACSVTQPSLPLQLIGAPSR